MPKKIRIPVNFSLKHVNIIPITPEEQRQISRRIHAIENEILREKSYKEARNMLESYIYTIEDYLNDHNANLVTSDTERTTFKSLLSSVSSWLHNQTGFDAEISEYFGKLNELEKYQRLIAYRLRENERRPNLVKELKQTLKNASDFLAIFYKKIEDYSRYTKEELIKFEETINNAIYWLEEKEKIQNRLSLNQDPVLTSNDLEKNLLHLKSEIFLLENKPWPLRNDEVPVPNMTSDFIPDDASSHSINLSTFANMTSETNPTSEQSEETSLSKESSEEVKIDVPPVEIHEDL
jgi:hypothetical protein